MPTFAAREMPVGGWNVEATAEAEASGSIALIGEPSKGEPSIVREPPLAGRCLQVRSRRVMS